MAQKPDGKPAGIERVAFTRPAAERIAKVVRRVEQGGRDAEPLRFDRVSGGTPSRLSVATFTGAWATGTYKTVTLVNSTNTASVYNWCNAAEEGTSTRHVVFGRASGTNSVLEITMGSTCGMIVGGVDLTQLAGYSAGEIQILGHNTTGPCLEWYSVTSCSTSAPE